MNAARVGRPRNLILIVFAAALAIGAGLFLVPDVRSRLLERMAGEKAGARVESGGSLADLELHDVHGNAQAIWKDGDSGLRVLVFLGCECPLAKHYIFPLNDLAKKFASQGVPLIGINSNDQDSLTEIADFSRQQKAAFPIYKDPQHRAADLLAAERTPEAFVVDRAGRVYYQGRIDDSSGIGYQRPKAQHKYLEDAVRRAVVDRANSDPAPAVGCIIGRKDRVAPHGDITYTRQVARIFYASCLECHREGQLAPFSLRDYDNAASWAQMIAEVVREERMPPWLASPEYGHFANDRRLSKEDRQTILQWVENGCPKGDPAEMPTPPNFTENWRIDQPDLVLHMRETPFDVPPEGPISYQLFVVETNLKEDRWIQQAEVRPGNPSVVHHCSIWIIPPGGAREVFDAQPAFAYGPGVAPLRLPSDGGILLRAGSALLFQLHYEPNGRAEKDRSYVGLHLVDAKKVRRPVVLDAFWPDKPIAIPPNASNYTVQGTITFARDAELMAMAPHMHLRGAAFRYILEYPDGKEEILLDVPRYDFNWQTWYELATPKLIPKGSRLRGVGVFDNSDQNPRNPDPGKLITFGPRTEDEMFVGLFAAYDPATKNLPLSAYAFNAEGFGVTLPNDWALEVDKEAKASVLKEQTPRDWTRVRVEQLATGKAPEVRLRRRGIPLDPGQAALLEFTGKASKPRPVRARISSSDPAQATSTWEKEFLLSPTQAYFEAPLVFPKGLTDVTVTFDLGQTFGDVELGHVLLVQGSRR